MRQDAYDHDDLDEEEYDDDEEYDEEDRDEEDEDREEDEEEDEDEQGGDEHDPSGLQALLRRLGGGLEDMIPAAGQTRGRLKEILGGLRADGDDTRQIMALNELCELLVISSEESLITLSVDAFVPVLVNLMQMEHNPDCMLLAARALTSMADILPNSRGAIVHYGALPAFCSRLLTIEYIDLAEQSLQALEKLSQDHGSSCLREGAMMACLSYLDFFSLGMQRVALQTAANVCRQLPASDCWDQLSDSVPVLTNLLMHDDARLVESACTCLTLIAANLSSQPQQLQALCSHGLIPNATRLISPSGSATAAPVGASTYHGLIRLIGTCCKGSADVAEQLLRNGLPGTLKSVLAGCKVLASSTASASPASPIVSADQLLEVTTLANQLLPSIQPGSGASESPLESLGIDAAPELLREYGSNLTSSLMQVVVASVGTNVKLQCLAALAKFLHHAPPEMLISGSAALQPGQMASFLAGLVSSRDGAIAQVALYIVDLLMQKLPDTFSRAFRKEGTVHAIEQLCEMHAASNDGSGDSKGSSGDITPRGQVVPSGVGSGSAASIVARMALTNSGRKMSDTPQRRAAMDRAVSLRAAHFSAAATGGTVERLQSVCAPLRNAGQDPLKATAVAMKFLNTLDEGEGTSTFELIESGGVEALSSFLTGSDLPKGDGWSDSISARLSAFVRAASTDLPPRAISSLTERLLEALAVTETLPMQLSAGARAGAGAGAAGDGLSILARPFKLRLRRASGERAELKDYASNIILVEPLATLNAIEDFLYPRVHKPPSGPATPAGGASASGTAPTRRSGRLASGAESMDANEEEEEDHEMRGDEEEEGDGEEDFDDEELDDEEDGEEDAPTADDVAAAAPPRLLFRAPGVGPFHPSTSVLQAIHAAALHASAAAEGDEQGDGHEDETADAAEALAALGSVERRAALGGVLSALRGKLCDRESVANVSDATRSILTVLSVLHTVSTSASRIINLGEQVDDVKVTALSLPADAFLSSKLAGKMVRQLQDALALCSGSLPTWCTTLARACPFLFPFEVRQQLFYCTTFGLARALHRMHGQSQDNNGGGGGRDLRVGRLQRQKVRVSRQRILESAMKVYEMPGAHKMVLEVEFFNEVGTGTGPTLEFYTLMSKEVTQRSLKAWRDAPVDGKPGPADGFVNAPHGLFPAPVSAKDFDATVPGAPGGIKRGDLFRMLGRAVGKALQDGRLLDMALSPVFFRAVSGRTLALDDLAEVDPELGRTLSQLSAAAKRIDALKRSGAAEKEWRAITVGGAAVEDLCLTFTLPGDDTFELMPGGAEVAVTAENLGDYVAAVVDASVGGGISRQLDAFRGGLADVLPPVALGMFTEPEIDRMLCGQGQAWTPELLGECMTYDHGYNAQSPPIKALVEVMCGYGPEEQRAFLRFVTGAPRLPPGGLAALQPRLTVPLSSGTTLADADLPSAMTCASYLKLPPYSCVDVLKERLGYAITEGIGSFDLS
ncbi:predicted protein [Micromonas commoda]|uniref:HECT-type E3 ubiquitin transferase n=1 Tax=Micromonas commoda (strain RCC299 / NOUM17 / CCMP2709) TaxID=296587 RepID=C1EAL8_MICCC|nr:predicted protein [Micromonas commoda]ACO64882.1 predicted protein [Micromonas commoda]|eukprot:XP_002503624.1 predicted protein [Micromonas commoda]